jgi:hypothetical protein
VYNKSAQQLLQNIRLSPLQGKVFFFALKVDKAQSLV